MPLGRAILADVETTGLDEPDVIQLAYSKPFTWGEEITVHDYTVKMFKPRKLISPGAKAAHHIIEADLADCPPWSGSYYLDAEYLIGHGIDFDWKVLGEQPLVKRICTLALSRMLYDDETDSHSLSALMYCLYDDTEARAMAMHAHQAAQDVQMTWLLFKELISDAQVTWPLAGFEDLWRLSEQARIPRRLSFGKYGPKDGKRGLLYSEVDSGYLEWMLKQDFDEYTVLAATRELKARGIL